MAGKNLGTLTIDLVAKVGGFVQGMTAAERAAQKSAKGASDSYRRAAKDIDSSNNQIVSSVQNMAGALAAAFTVSKIVGFTEAYTTMNNRLLLVTNGTKEFAEAQKSIIAIAQSNRTGLSETAELYQRIATNQKELSLTGQEVADVVDTISKTMVISGSSAEAANGALVQLGQAFASGTLRGQELNSVMEQAPALAKAIAEGLNIPIGKLREVSQAGELSAKAVIAALQAQASAVDENFGKMSATIGQSMTVLNNSLIVAVGEMDKATGASAALSGAIITVANSINGIASSKETLKDIADAIAVVGLAIASRLVAPTLVSAAAFVSAQREAVRYQLALAAMAGVSTRTAVALGTLSVAARGASAAMALLGGPVGLVLLAVSALTYFIATSDDASDSTEKLAEKVDYLNASFDGFTKNQAQAAMLDIGEQLNEATLRAIDAGDAVNDLQNKLRNYPSDARVSEWNNQLIKARAEFDGVNQEVTALNGKLQELQGIVKNIDLGESVQAASKAYTDLSSKIQEQIILHGLNSEAQKLEARISNGYITGLLDGEADKLIALQKTRDAQVASAEAEKARQAASKRAASEAEAASKRAAEAARRHSEAIESDISAIERAAKVWGMTADEVQIYDLRLKGASETQIKYAEGLLKSVSAMEQQKKSLEEIGALRASLDDSLNAERQQGKDELAGIGLSDKAEQRLKAQRSLIADYQKQISDAARDRAKGDISQDAYVQQLAMYKDHLDERLELQDEYYSALDDMQGSWQDGASKALANYAEEARDVYGQTAELIGDTMSTLTDGIASSMTDAILYGEDLRTSLSALADTITESVLNSLIEMGVQYGVNAALEAAGIATVSAAKIAATSAETAVDIASTTSVAAAETAAAGTVAAAKIAAITATTTASTVATTTTTATQTAAAATTAAAWTPAAIVSSIGSFGTAAAIGLAAVVAALAFTGGFRKGGYTGGGGVDDVAGVVHGQEYVFDAEATKRIGVANLEAIRAGRTTANSGGVAFAEVSGATSTERYNGRRDGVSVTQNITTQGRIDRRTSNQLATDSARKTRIAQARLA